MSTLSPGSKAATNLFIVLGIVVLIALAVSTQQSGNQKTENYSGITNCDERLIKAGSFIWADGQNVMPVKLSYALHADGTVTDIKVISTPSANDAAAMQAIAMSSFAPAPLDSAAVNCEHSFTAQK
jgi:membrane protein involved in colicin uptake